MSDNQKHKPHIRSRRCIKYEEATDNILIYTADGLRARVYYATLDRSAEFELWIVGDKRYGLAAFVVYMTMKLRGNVPKIARIGSSMSELTRV